MRQAWAQVNKRGRPFACLGLKMQYSSLEKATFCAAYTLRLTELTPIKSYQSVEDKIKRTDAV